MCLGNICRSPLAEAVFNRKIVEKGLDDKLVADSAGTSNYHIGADPDRRTFDVARKYGLALDHKGRQLNKQDFVEFDYILAMDAANYQDILYLYGDRGKESGPEIIKMRKFENDGTEKDVPDPYYGGESGFDNVYQILDRTIDNFIDYLIDKHQLKAG